MALGAAAKSMLRAVRCGTSALKAEPSMELPRPLNVAKYCVDGCLLGELVNAELRPESLPHRCWQLVLWQSTRCDIGALWQFLLENGPVYFAPFGPKPLVLAGTPSSRPRDP